MKLYRPLGLLSTVFLLVGAVLLFSPASVFALEWSQTTVSMKAGITDKKADATFEFRNSGKRPITITQISSSCGCTVATVKRKTYMPGESGEIHATFEFGNRSGPQHKLITITTDEPETRPYALTLEVDIPRMVQVSPIFVSWQREDLPSPKVITARLHEAVGIESVESQDSRFKTSVRRDAIDPTLYYIAIEPKDTIQRANAQIFLRLKGEAVAPVVMHAVISDRPND